MSTKALGPITQRQAAVTAGLALLIMALAAAFAYGFAHAQLLVQGDAEATLRNIAARPLLFKAEITGWLLVLVCDIATAWALYWFFKPVQAPLSQLAAWLRLLYTAMLGAAVAQLLSTMLLARHAADAAFLPAGQLQAHALLGLEAFEAIWSAGLIIFGGHLLLIGVLALRSRSVPAIIGILLLFGGLGYIVIHPVKALFPEYEGAVRVLEYVFIAPMTAGELGLGLWLLVRGGRAGTADRQQDAIGL